MKLLNSFRFIFVALPAIVSQNVSTLEAVRKDMKFACYACATSDDSGDCRTNSLEIQKSSPNNSPDMLYARNCSEELNETFCMIETIESNGQIMSYMRDCSNGLFFSNNFTKTLSFVKPDNRSNCVYRDKFLFCVYLCKTRFCNGPHPINVVPTGPPWMPSAILVWTTVVVNTWL